jgi:replicative DNA helicase Mcm
VTALERDVWEIGKTGILIPNMQDLTEFLETYCEDEIYALANDYPNKTSLYIKHKDIYKFSRGLSLAIENCFFKVEPILKLALLDTKPFRYRDDSETVSDKIKLRISSVMSTLKQPIRDLGKKDIGKLVCVDGYIRLVSDTEPMIKKAAFECLRCGHVTYVEQNGLKFEEPFAGCESDSCGKKGPFNVDTELSEYIDFQRIQIQELPDSTTGTRTHDIIVECEEDLTNIVKPGDRVTVTGVLVLRQKSGRDGKKTVYEKIIKSLSLEKQDLGFDEYIITPSDEDKIIELSKDPEVIAKIINSIAPSIYGYEDIKEAIALHLFSGVKKYLPDGSTQRGVIHLGFIGDPGGAKTQLLRRAVQISPRGVYASGKTTSAAGLTAAAVKDPLNEGSWVLEGGAAVMASGGTLAIDEIGQAREEDKSALHEVMEHGCISVAKAGNVTTLKAECGVIMAGNPEKGYFDRYIGFADQVGIPPALWSRISLMFILLDNPEEKKDTAISNHVLRNHRIGGMIQNFEHAKTPLFSESQIKEATEEIKAPIDENLLRMYIAYSRMYIYPVASKEISDSITHFYVDVRKLKLEDPNNPVPITARTVEDVQRLAEAHARMRLSNEVSKEDVAAAKRIMIQSLKDIGMDENGRLDANMLYGGTSKSQQEKIEIIIQVIKQEKHEDMIYARMKNEHEIDSTEVFSLLRSLSKTGKIWKNGGEWRTV